MNGFMDMIWAADEWFWAWIPYFLMLEGVLLTVSTRGLWLYKVKDIWQNSMVRSLKGTGEKGVAGTIGGFKAAMTNLGNTVGTGNISGCAAAIASGGPGAIFWMWVLSLVGASVKACEILLAQKFRVKLKDGNYVNSRVWLTATVLGLPGLAAVFAWIEIAIMPLSSCVQVGAISESLDVSFGFNPTVVTIIATVLAFIICLGGLKRIAEVANSMVPFMCVAYIVCGLIIIITHLSEIPAMFGMIFKYAFTPMAGVGGALGFTVSQAFRFGAARGVYSTDAGLLAASCTYSAAETDHPGRIATWGLTENFIDTLIVCTITAMAVLLSGLYTTETSASLATLAFEATLGKPGMYVVCIATVFFAFTTLIASYYCTTLGVTFLTRKWDVKKAKTAMTIFAVWFFAWQFCGSLDADFLWAMADFASIASTLIAGVVLFKTLKICREETLDFWKRFLPDWKAGKNPEPCTYEIDGDQID